MRGRYLQLTKVVAAEVPGLNDGISAANNAYTNLVFIESCTKNVDEPI
jgi:hypothetical protein